MPPGHYADRPGVRGMYRDSRSCILIKPLHDRAGAAPRTPQRRRTPNRNSYEFGRFIYCWPLRLSVMRCVCCVCYQPLEARRADCRGRGAGGRSGRRASSGRGWDCSRPCCQNQGARGSTGFWSAVNRRPVRAMIWRPVAPLGGCFGLAGRALAGILLVNVEHPPGPSPAAGQGPGRRPGDRTLSVAAPACGLLPVDLRSRESAGMGKALHRTCCWTRWLERAAALLPRHRPTTSPIFA